MAQETAPPAVRGVEKFNLSTGGMGLYRPETWGVISVNLRNPQDREVDLLATTHFVGDPTLQFGCRIWMPPHSRMRTWHPLRMPAVSDPEQKFFDMRTLVLSREEGGAEVLAMNDVGAMQFDQSLRISSAKPVTAYISEPGLAPSEGSSSANPIDLLLTARVERGQTGNLSNLAEPLAPAGEEMLDALDQLVIADDRILTDAAGIGAIRRWVAGGGRLWVMADQVSPEVLEALLGNEDALTVVDQVGLTSVSMINVSGVTVNSQFERDLDRPVTFVRVIAENARTAYQIDGWPAAFWKTYGDGQVLVTTLGPDGWLRARESRDPFPATESGDSFKTDFFPSEPLNSLAAEFFIRRPAPALPVSVVEDQIRLMVGYTIPSRGIVLGTLLGFSALLAVCGAWLSTKGQSEWLGVATPVLALIAAGLLLSAGMKSRSDVPDSTSSLQLIQAVPGTADIRVGGIAGVFTQGGTSTASLSGTRGGWMMPEMSGIEGTTRRMVWTDIDRWSWEDLPQNPGLRTIVTQSSGRAALPLSATAGFHSGVMSGQVMIPQGLQPTDAFFATNTGRIGLNISDDGRWTAGSDSVLGADQYLSAHVLSDEQQRRTRILSELLKSVPARPMPPVPTLYFWTKPWDVGMSYGPDALMTGSALVAVPVTWQRPEAGSEFIVPTPLLKFYEVDGPDGARPSGFFDTRAGVWVPRRGATSGWVAFDLPPEILPLELKRVDVTLKVIGAVGRLEVSGYKDGAVQSIKSWNNPVGTLTLSIDDTELVKLNDKGRLMFRIDAGIADAETWSGESPDGESSRTSAGEKVPAQDPNTSNTDLFSLEAPPTYWEFEEISTQITVGVPRRELATSPAL